MCVAVPGKLITLSEDKTHGQADFNGSIIGVNLSLVDAAVGDYVLVHAGCAIEIMEKSTAEELSALFGELNDAIK